MIVAHDLGTSADKASLHDDSGRLLASTTVPYPTRFSAGGVAEQDPEDWWQAVGQATRGLLSTGGYPAGDVRAIVLSGQMMGAVFLDAAHRPLRPAFIWADHRSEPQARRLRAAMGDQEAYALLGHRVHTTYTLPKLMWVREHEPEVWSRTRKVCLAKDFVNARLTGALVTDHSDASSTNAYDLCAGTWASGMLEAGGIGAEVLPEIVPSTTVLGGVTAEAARHTGLRAGTPVVVGGGDGPMASVGAGAVLPASGSYVCLGTSAWVAFSADEPVFDPLRRSFTFRHVVPGQFVPTATMQAAGACLQWVVDLLEPGGGPDRFPRLLAEAATGQGAEAGLYFLPYLLGERSPHWDASATGTFLGLQRHHGRGDLVRAVLEGVAFNLRSCLDAFAASGIPVAAVDLIGGAASSDVWLQVLADVWGIPVRRREVREEATSLGAAVTALVAIGACGFDSAPALSATETPVDPDPRRSLAYREEHLVFLDAYDRLAGWFPGRQPVTPTTREEP